MLAGGRASGALPPRGSPRSDRSPPPSAHPRDLAPHGSCCRDKDADRSRSQASLRERGDRIPLVARFSSSPAASDRPGQRRWPRRRPAHEDRGPARPRSPRCRDGEITLREPPAPRPSLPRGHGRGRPDRPARPARAVGRVGSTPSAALWFRIDVGSARRSELVHLGPCLRRSELPTTSRPRSGPPASVTAASDSTTARLAVAERPPVPMENATTAPVPPPR